MKVGNFKLELETGHLWSIDVFILFHRYNANLMHAKNNSAKKGVVLGLTVSAFWFLIFAALSVAFYYGVKLMQDPDEDFDPGDTLTVSSTSCDIYRLISFDYIYS